MLFLSSHRMAGLGLKAVLIATFATAGLSGCKFKDNVYRAGEAIDRALGTDQPPTQQARLQPKRQPPTSLLRFRDRTVDRQSKPAAPAPAPAKQDEPATGDALYRDGLAAQRANRHEQAAALFRKAAELGHGAAAYELADAYHFGRGVEQDADQAAAWVQKAADYGNPQAQYIVGSALYYGRGLPHDPARAAKYLLPAARHGDARAEYLLGEAYANGNGVQRDLPWSAHWYGKAAAQGHGPAQFAYGVAWATGLGVPRNLETAYYWLTVAANNGVIDAADVRDVIGQQVGAAAQERSRNDAGRFEPTDNSPITDPPTVLFVQMALDEMGYDPGEPDGHVGDATRQAIESFQRINGYPDDGQITAALLQQILNRRRGVSAVASDETAASDE